MKLGGDERLKVRWNCTLSEASGGVLIAGKY